MAKFEWVVMQYGLSTMGETNQLVDKRAIMVACHMLRFNINYRMIIVDDIKGSSNKIIHFSFISLPHLEVG